jgi:hypothetical protein
VNDRRFVFAYRPEMDMAQHPGLKLQPARIATGSDETGVLVLAEGRIVAILVRLDAPFHGNLRGRWFLEIGFGRCAGTPEPFERLSDGLTWIARRLDEEAAVSTNAFAGADRFIIRAAEDGTGARSPPSP